ncbi:DUF429 domain-containing protein [Haloferax namakaokahaiae]|uniref:DUF429 domain-containing protein n=1 Tax=Haloferax namakaokahaiae TaxID=1748331 RepID=A0ABD5ZEV2_9EURY
MTTPPSVVGVDGCRTGWVCAYTTAHALHIETLHSFSVVRDLAVELDAERVLVDIPIGLPETGRRSCDSIARELMGSRAATVFYAPVRAVLDESTHERASAVNRAQSGYGLSVQAWHLVPKIREVDAVLQTHPDARGRILEAHPELAFRAFAGEPLSAKKSTEAGRSRRLELLRDEFGDADPEAVYRETVAQTYRKDVARDDVIDALVLAASARRPLESHPASPPTDATGLPMAIHEPLTSTREM